MDGAARTTASGLRRAGRCCWAVPSSCRWRRPRTVPPAPRWTAWGRVAATGFYGEDDGSGGPVTLDGDVVTGQLGVDAEWSRWLTGVAVAVSEGDGDFSTSGTCAAPSRCGRVLESSLTSVNPYLRLDVNERISVCRLAGYGWGDCTMTEGAAGNQSETVTRTDISMTMGAAGACGALLTAPEANGFELALRTDASWMRMDSEAAANTVETQADASRVRLIWEGSRAPRAGACRRPAAPR